MVPFFSARYVDTFGVFDVNRAISMLIHGSGMVAVAQGLVEYRDSRWIFSALRQDLKNPSTVCDAESPCAASSDGGGGRGRGRTMTKVFLRFLPHDNRLHPVLRHASDAHGRRSSIYGPTHANVDEMRGRVVTTI